jgi:NAD dependent epimerase/dehydratase family enzyme
VLRSGWFYGRGATYSEQLFAQARRDIGLVLGRPASYVSSIHLADAATAVAPALHGPAGTLNVVDDEPLTKRESANALACAPGKTTWLRGPGRVALVFGDRLTSLIRSLSLVLDWSTHRGRVAFWSVWDTETIDPSTTATFLRSGR